MVRNKSSSATNHKWEGHHNQRGVRDQIPNEALLAPRTYTGKTVPMKFCFENQWDLTPGVPKISRT